MCMLRMNCVVWRVLNSGVGMNHDFIFMNLISFSSLWKYVVKGQISARIESHVSKIESALVQTIGYKLLIVGLISTLRSVPAIIADSL